VSQWKGRMLYDKARIFVQAGRGGDGCKSFRREAHVPRGGPDGGDGGRGGAVVLRCDDSLRDLQSFKRRAHYKAARGRHGEGALRHGADGEDLVVGVPPGTQVARWDGEAFDLVVPGRRVVIARGGSGGRGNKKFASSTRQAPRFAERGLEGEEGEVELRLKLLADVGLVGLPNAGKSSLLGRMTRAAPKVAGYPFTTLEPHLGTLEGADRQLILADIPGLIEGASEGAGLGHDFLAHVERTRLLVHVLDLAPLDGSDPEANFAVIERELAAHDARLAALPRVLVLSKADLVTEDAAAAARVRWAARFAAPEREEWEPADPDAEFPVLVTSAATGQGIDELAALLLRRVPVQPPAEQDPVLAGEDELPEHRVFRPADRRGFTVERIPDGGFRVAGEQVERLLARHDLDNDEALAHVEHRLHRLGVVRALEAEGFEPGDDVEIAGVVFELDPG
jgi:GTPase